MSSLCRRFSSMVRCANTNARELYQLHQRQQSHKHTKIVDLRSDTVTQPTAGMRAAMAAAEVGDDVYGEDPTVNQLQLKVAALFRKEAGLFVPSGTMANLISVMAHTWERGSEYIVGDQSHLNIWEQGGAAQFGGVNPRTVRHLPDGTFCLDEIESCFRADDQHFPVTKLVCVENTFGGSVVPLEFVDALGELAHTRSVRMHIDGARLWNAVIASGVSADRWSLHADSVSVCLSKGLGAPAGSVIVGSHDFIARCHRLRKGLGGGLRQSGVLAAAGLYALEHHLPLLARDHTNAAELAQALRRLPGVEVELATNMLHVDMESASLTAPATEDALREHYGVECFAESQTHLRLVVHMDVDAAGVQRTATAFENILK